VRSVKYTAVGRTGAPVRRPKVAGPAGRLTEELDLDAGAPDVAVAEQTDDVVALQGRSHLAAGVGAERHDVHAQSAAELLEPVEELGRVDCLDDGGEAVPPIGHPPTGPLPTAEVRLGQDHAPAALERLGDVFVAVDAHTPIDRPAAEMG